MTQVQTSVGTNYGPLRGLLGTWRGNKGRDLSPEPHGAAESAYSETLTFEPCGCATNAEKQTLSVVRYHQVVRRASNGEVFHDQVGYWTWDPATGVISQSLTIPRSVCVLAGGRCPTPPDGLDADAEVTLSVAAKLGDPDWGILQSPFMREHARTTEYRHRLTFRGRGDRLEYAETTVLQIYGKTFEHTDQNTLTRGE